MRTLPTAIAFVRLQPKRVYISQAHSGHEREDFFQDLYSELLMKGFKNVDQSFDENGPKATPVKVHVGWGKAALAEGLVVLGTDGIGVCSALELNDPTSNNLHYLLHAFPNSTRPEHIADSLRKASSLGMSLKDAEIKIMPGHQLDQKSTPHILEGIYTVDSSLLDNVELIRDFGKEDETQALIAYDGTIYKYPYRFNYHARNLDVRTLSKDGYQKVIVDPFTL